MPADPTPPSARRDELLDAAYDYVLTHGLADMSLRPLASAIGSSPRVLLFLFGSKDGLVRALLHRARTDELALVRQLRTTADFESATAVEELWSWLAAPRHRPLLTLWAQAYTRSLSEPDGPWAGFARATVRDWLRILTGPRRDPEDATLALAILRGCLLDLLATDDHARVTAAVRRQAAMLRRHR